MGLPAIQAASRAARAENMGSDVSTMPGSPPLYHPPGRRALILPQSLARTPTGVDVHNPDTPVILGSIQRRRFQQLALAHRLHSPKAMHVQRLAPLALLALALVSRPGAAHAESAVAYTDIALHLTSPASTVDSESIVQVTLTLANEGTFGTGSASVSVPLPEGLSFVGAVTETGSYDSQTAMWTSSTISSYESFTLVLDYMVNSEGPSEITVTAELIAFDSEYGSYDPDSVPDNGDECEDDYDSLTLQVAGRPLLDAGVPATDCEPEGPGQPIDPTIDAGVQGGLDAGSDLGSGDGGCSTSGSGGSSVLALLALALLLRRRRTAA